jgi:hypothetical protein
MAAVAVPAITVPARTPGAEPGGRREFATTARTAARGSTSAGSRTPVARAGPGASEQTSARIAGAGDRGAVVVAHATGERSVRKMPAIA